MTDHSQTDQPNGAGADIDAVETSEWLEALDAVVEHDGPDRARAAADARRRARPARRHAARSRPQHAVRQHDPARARGAAPRRPGARAPAALDRPLERDGDGRARQQALLRARRPHRHLPVAGDAVRGRLQPLLARPVRGARRRPRLLPGPLLARATTRARTSRAGSTEEQLDGFRQEVGGRRALVLPAPVADARLLAVPDGLARDRRDHLDLPGPVHEVPRGARRSRTPTGRKVWAFLGDGEMDEPESMGAIALAGRERLDNLIWVVNCNLQRLDGPVRGNGKIIQELESDFRGAGWNVIKVIWGSRLGSAARRRHRRPPRQGDGGVRRRRVPDVQVARRRVRARALLRPGPGPARARLAHVRRGDLAAEPRRTRPAEGLRRLPRGRRATPASRR